MSEERVGEGIAERLNSGPARKEVKRPRNLELSASDPRYIAYPEAVYVLSLERKIEELEADDGKGWDEVQKIQNYLADKTGRKDWHSTYEAIDSLRAQAEALAVALEEIQVTFESSREMRLIAKEALAAYRAVKEEQG